MKDIVNYINESNSDFCYAIRYFYYSDEPLAWKFQTSYQRAKSFIQTYTKKGMKVSGIYEVDPNNWEEFKKNAKRNGISLDKLKEISNEYFNKEDIDNFLNKK